MKVGGTGDTLAGVVAALLEHAEPLEAAAAGAQVNGIAGERLAETRSSASSRRTSSRNCRRSSGVITMCEGSEDGSVTADELTHTTADGDAQMVDVGDKPDSERRAVAVGEIHLRPSTIEAIRDDRVGKGDVLATARVGAIQAVKHTWETIPMCHQIPITNVDTDFSLAEDRIELRVAVETTGKTGCEMEASRA